MIARIAIALLLTALVALGAQAQFGAIPQYLPLTAAAAANACSGAPTDSWSSTFFADSYLTIVNAGLTSKTNPPANNTALSNEDIYCHATGRYAFLMNYSQSGNIVIGIATAQLPNTGSSASLGTTSPACSLSANNCGVGFEQTSNTPFWEYSGLGGGNVGMPFAIGDSILFIVDLTAGKICASNETQSPGNFYGAGVSCTPSTMAGAFSFTPFGVEMFIGGYWDGHVDGTCPTVGTCPGIFMDPAPVTDVPAGFAKWQSP